MGDAPKRETAGRSVTSDASLCPACNTVHGDVGRVLCRGRASGEASVDDVWINAWLARGRSSDELRARFAELRRPEARAFPLPHVTITCEAADEPDEVCFEWWFGDDEKITLYAEPTTLLRAHGGEEATGTLPQKLVAWLREAEGKRRERGQISGTVEEQPACERVSSSARKGETPAPRLRSNTTPAGGPEEDGSDRTQVAGSTPAGSFGSRERGASSGSSPNAPLDREAVRAWLRTELHAPAAVMLLSAFDATFPAAAASADEPHVCPGCHAVNAPCAPGCIDAEIARESEDRAEREDDDAVEEDESEDDDRRSTEWSVGDDEDGGFCVCGPWRATREEAERDLPDSDSGPLSSPDLLGSAVSALEVFKPLVIAARAVVEAWENAPDEGRAADILVERRVADLDEVLAGYPATPATEGRAS